MTTPRRQLLEEALGTLTRGQALLERAAEDLDPVFGEALRMAAEDVQRIRRRVRRQVTTLTAGGGGGQ